MRCIKEPSTRGAPPPSLGYARPAGRRYRFKHIAAILFSVCAFLIAGYFGIGAAHFLNRSLTEPTTLDKSKFLHDALQCLACSLLLIIPAIWYGRIGYRGEITQRYYPAMTGEHESR